MRIDQHIRAVALAALAAAAAACGGDEVEPDDVTTREVITQPGTEVVEVTVPTVDTAVVERTVDVDVDVDTIQEPGVERTDGD